jgi:N-acetylmuramic acid 6-phosphate etherase
LVFEWYLDGTTWGGGMDTEGRLQRYRDADCWPTEEALAAMLDNQQSAFAAVLNALPTLGHAVQAAAARLREAGRLIYVGAGASGRLAVQDGVELHPTFGWPHERLVYLLAGGDAAVIRSVEGAEDDAAGGCADMAGLAPSPSDVVVSVAASGTTAFTRAAQSTARAAGALTITMANNPMAPLLAEGEIAVLLHTGPEFLAGSTRMTAGTAQKIALNLFSTQLMTELGRVYQGLMVNVVPANAKLVDRSQRIVQAITGCGREQAAAAWERAGRDIKLAVLLLDGLGPREAAARLEDAHGDLRRARIAQPDHR